MAGNNNNKRRLLEDSKTAIVIDKSEVPSGISPPPRRKPAFQGYSDVWVDVDVWEAQKRRKKPKIFHPSNYANARPTHERRRPRRIEDINLVKLGDDPLAPTTSSVPSSLTATAAAVAAAAAALSSPSHRPHMHQPTTPTSTPSHHSHSRRCWMSPRSRRSVDDDHGSDADDTIPHSRIGQQYQATVCASLSQEDKTPTVVCDGTEGDVLWDPQRAALAENQEEISKWK